MYHDAFTCFPVGLRRSYFLQRIEQWSQHAEHVSPRFMEDCEVVAFEPCGEFRRDPRFGAHSRVSAELVSDLRDARCGHLDITRISRHESSGRGEGGAKM